MQRQLSMGACRRSQNPPGQQLPMTQNHIKQHSTPERCRRAAAGWEPQRDVRSIRGD